MTRPVWCVNANERKIDGYRLAVPDVGRAIRLTLDTAREHHSGVNARLILLGVAGFVAGIGAFVGAEHADHAAVPHIPSAPLTLLVAWSFIVSGLLSWRAAPGNRLAPAMVVSGFAWLTVVLPDSGNAFLFTFGVAFQYVALAGFVFIVLSFPSGRLQTSLDRVLVVGAVVAVTVVQLGSLVFTNSQAILCTACPDNLLEITRDDALANGFRSVQRIMGVDIVVVALIVLVLRWWRSSPPQRRAIAPVVLAGSAALTALAADIIDGLSGGANSGEFENLFYYAFATVPIAVMFVFLQRRLARAGVAGLVVELGQSTSSVELGRALARALGDLSLELAYWFPAERRFVDGDGAPVVPPDSDSGRSSTVVERDGRRIAVLIHDPALEHNVELVNSVCAAAGLTLENERLKAELRARLVELQASRARLVGATDAERRRIERDLHDGTQQRLVSIAMSLGLLESKLPAGLTEAQPIVHEARTELAAALAELRDLTQGIHPTILVERGLPAALDELCQRSPVPAHLQAALDERLPEQVESAAYFFVSEALNNAAKHSHASEVRVTASREASQLVVEVADDGIGGAASGGGSGLRGLADRIEALGGRFTVSSPPGRGTTLRGEIPVRVVVADDAVILREGLVRLLREASFEVVGSAADGEELIALVGETRPDVAIVDIRMPPSHTDEGLRAAKEIRRRWPETGILVLSQHVHSRYALELLADGTEGVGYLLKERVSDLDELASSVHRVGDGGSVLDPAVVGQLVGRRRQGGDPLEHLTERERDVLVLMAEGRSNRAIAERLFVTEHTVEKHVKNIFATLRLPPSPDDHRRVLAVVTYLNAQ
jgi:signal transduction histidine kinase/DNA-binding NarL/FixJ family response regulator